MQHYANRPDQMGGSTLGNIADTKLPIPTVDIGMAQLAMHSCFETMGGRDVEAFVRAVRACYERTCASRRRVWRCGNGAGKPTPP